MAGPNSRWEDIEAFVQSPHRAIAQVPEETIFTQNLNTWGNEDFLPWRVPMMSTSWENLSRAYYRERTAKQDLDYWSYAMDLNAGGTIGSRSQNIFQRHNSGLHFLIMSEVLIRSQVLSDPTVSSYRIVCIREDLSDLIDCSMTVNPAAKVKDATHHFVHELPGERGRRRSVFTSDQLDSIDSDLKVGPGKLLHLIVASCVVGGQDEAINMLEEEASFRENQQIFSFIVFAIERLAEGGSIILRVHGSSDGFFAANIYVLSLLFEEVSFMKPLTSLDCEMQVFVVAKGFSRQDRDKFEQFLKDYLGKMVLPATPTGHYPLPEEMIPDLFLQNLAEALSPFFTFVAGCKSRNAVYTAEKGNRDQRIRQLLENKEEQIQRYRIATVTEWMFAVRLEKYHYPSQLRRERRVLRPVQATQAGEIRRLPEAAAGPQAGPSTRR